MTRIGVIGPQDPDSFAANILQCLPDLGVEAIPLGTPRPAFRNHRATGLYDIAARGLPWLDGKLQKQLVRRTLDNDCDLVITVQSELMPPVVDTLRRSGVPVVIWFPDAISNFGRGLLFASPYSRLYLKDPTAAERLEAITGISATYLPEACNPHRHRPPEGVVPDSDGPIVVAGNVYPTRARLLMRMIDDGDRVEIYGNPLSSWLPQHEALARHHRQRSIVYEDKARIFRGAVAVLNNLHPSELNSMNCRLFEATACGAAVLTEYRSTLDELYEPDEEVLAFRDYGELRRQITRLRRDPHLAVRIGNQAALRAHSEHTYQRRLGVILQDHL